METYKYCPSCAYISIYNQYPYCGTHLIHTDKEYNPTEWSKNRLAVIHNINKEYDIKSNPRYDPQLQQLRESQEQMRYKVIRNIIE